jgi:hypothetical protein
MKTKTIRVYPNEHALVLKIAKRSKKTASQVMEIIINDYMSKRALEGD